ncbi:MAG: hypothetical protein HYT62_04800 [Candidatus Yanofskybacteria bacterium]|nr:hypothetical protein [Candidatus Yanofskybacteria bacterium]
MKHVVKDSVIILCSIALAIVIAELNLIEKLLLVSGNFRIIGSFVGGLFFTSIFTTAPAIVFLGEISQVESILIVALIGAIGAVLGDMIIFYLFRSHVSVDLNELIAQIKIRPFKAALDNKGLHWLEIFIGALIIASPLPDELGIAMIGISKLNTRVFIPISFVFNFAGIFIIGSASRLIS